MRSTMTRSLRPRLFSLALALTLAAGAALPAGAQQPQLPQPQPQQNVGIAAVVNDEAVTTADVVGRMRLATASSGLPDTPETRQRLLPQVLRLLIDEVLQVQEARKLEIEVTETEIDMEMEQVAQRNRMTIGQFREALAQAGIPEATMRQQVRASLAWSKLVQRRIRPTVSVAEEEIQAYAERIKANAGKPEYLVAEIFLAVDTPAAEEDARRLAERLVDQISQGASFQAIAQQFSQGAGAATGGDIGWIQQGQLEPALDRTLQQLKPGQFSRPVRGVGGYHVLWVRDQRIVTVGNPDDIQISLAQFIVPVPPGTDPAQQYQQVTQVAQEAASCQALQNAAGSVAGAQTASLPLTRMGDVPEEIRGLVGNLGVGTPTQPLVTDVGVMLLMVCDRVVPEGVGPPADQIRNVLLSERMDMMQRRYLRDLRTAALIEYRI